MGDKEDDFVDNNNGTVSAPKDDLMWTKRDSRKELGKWLNWDEANDYVNACNEQNYLGYNDWRLPTKSEVRSLFKQADGYRKIFLNESSPKSRKCSDYQPGGDSSLWTCETRYDSYAWKCYFPKGNEVCVDQQVSTTGSTVRLVKDLD